jgi:hypothetical protein
MARMSRYLPFLIRMVSTVDRRLLENGGGNVIDWVIRNGRYQGYNTIGSAGGYGAVGVGDDNGDGTAQNASGSVIDWIMEKRRVREL